MYPNLYYVCKDWFGVEWVSLSFLNTFGLMVAIAFLIAAWVISTELKRKEKMGLLLYTEETIIVGKPASFAELFSNGALGFVFGYKLLGLIFFKPEGLTPQEYVFSNNGFLLGGILLGALLTLVKWQEKNKQRLKVPEERRIRIWPHDRVGDIIVLGLIFGILGSKIFDNLEHWDEFWQHPLESLISPSGLTFYGGLILASIVILWYAHKKGITIKYLVDAAAPALMIAYAVGRIGCQVAGDGDWGIYNSAYVNTPIGKIKEARTGDFDSALVKNQNYFLQGKIVEGSTELYVTDRVYASLSQVPHHYLKGPGFLPIWLFAYNYTQNVNKDGIPITGITDEHNKVLPSPVFPTPLYETILCTVLFFIMWIIRKKIKIPYVMFGLYLSLNGMERFFIECMRVNKPYTIMGIQATQAQSIAFLLFMSGLGLITYAKLKQKNTSIS
jgi:hypothetical protein